jgi:hypothetical protein
MHYKTMRGLGLALLFFYSAMASATGVSVAGFAFAGDFKSAAERFPYTFKLFKRQQAQGAKAGFSYLVNERTQLIKSKELEFHPADKLVNLKNSDQALMTVLVLTGETVSTEYFGSYYKTFVNLRGDALIFDYKSQTIVRSYPVSVVLFDATPSQPSEERIAGFVEDLIRREDARGLVTQFTRRLEAATLPKDGTKTIQVRKSVVAPEALALMPEALRKNPAAVEAMVSDSFASILSAKLGISMLPSAIGHAVGGVMSMRLENGDDFKLKLGEGDYLFELKLNKFAKIKTSENNIGTAYVYGAYGNVHFFEPTLNTDYLNSDFKNGETAVVPIDQVGTDDFSAYQDAIRGLFLKLADALQQPSGKWLTTAAAAKDIESQVEASREILRKTK